MPVAVFGGGAVQTAYVSFAALDISDHSITLVWPTSYFNVPSVVDGIYYEVLAASFTVNDEDDNENTVTLPDATESSVGSNFIITNIGQSPFQLLRSDGSELILLPNEPDTANSFWVQLIDNSTPEGTWAFVQFGAGTSSADASVLAGNGLIPLLGKLNTNITVQSILNAPYQILLTDRAKLLLWEAGTGQLVLPPIIDVPDGYYTSVNNEGSGVITIVGDTTIDNQASLIVSPGQSLSIITDGTKWWTLGFGQNIASSNFPPGSSISPSITFSTDPLTGIYYYQTPFPPVAPPGIGFAVDSSQVANFSNSGLFMTLGRNVNLQDSTGIALTQIISNANYGRILWDRVGLANPATLTVSGDNASSSLTLGPFSEFRITQGGATASLSFNGNDIIAFDNTASSFFISPVVFQDIATFLGTSTFNLDSIFNAISTFNSPVLFNDAVSLSSPLPLLSGGTGENNQQDALNAIMPPANVGDIVYFDHNNNWVSLPIGLIGQFLTVAPDGFGNLIPTWA
jgi:hypothetical protein